MENTSDLAGSSEQPSMEFRLLKVQIQVFPRFFHDFVDRNLLALANVSRGKKGRRVSVKQPNINENNHTFIISFLG